MDRTHWWDMGQLGAIAIVTALAAAGAGVAGCGSPSASPSAPTASTTPSVPTGTSSQSLRVDGVTRTYLVHRPATGATTRVPLVVFLHGGFGSGAQAERSYGWDAQADHAHFVVAYPDGLHRAWNAGGGCCGKPAEDGVDDVAFISQVVAHLEHQLPIDAGRIYATGISNGGIMAYRLACTTRIFAAIGPDSATMLGPCTSPAPTSVIHIHGTADTRIPYGGGTGVGVGHIDGPSVPAVNTTWRAIDDCGAPGVTVHAPVTTSIARCADGRAVELVSITGAGHQWPGSVDHPARRAVLGADAPSTALDATSAIWSFFAAHPAPAVPAAAVG